MRRFVNILFVAACALSLASCGSSKKLSDITGAQKLALDPCQEYADQKPTRRASGTGTHFIESTARSIAEADARAQLARALVSSVTSITKQQTTDNSQFSSDLNENSLAVSEQTSTVTDVINSVAKDISVAAAVVVKTSRYFTKDRQYQYFVCLEYKESAINIASKVAKAFNDKLSAQEKALINFNQADLEKRIAESIGE